VITTRVTSPFGFESTAAEVIAGIDLHDRQALVTGAASGIGVETARALASAGAQTVIAARDLAAAERTAADIRATTGNPAVSVARLDLLDRGSVDQLVRDLAGPLHILVNNAGVMAVPLPRPGSTAWPAGTSRTARKPRRTTRPRPAPTPPGSPPTRSTPKPRNGSGPCPSR
jgi:NAD(P)-dependent dehydrogenase (short-subunit alcohol dehydrogenase family)